MRLLLRTFGPACAVSVLAFAGTWWAAGMRVLAVVAILAVLEVSLSFDNAIVNARVLRRMNRTWQRLFLSVGIVVAVFGMRLAFPFAVVAVTARLSPVRVVDLAVRDPAGYAARVHEAQPAVAAFGGMFLMMIFLDFFLVERPEIEWLNRPETFLARLGDIPALPTIVSLVLLLATVELLAADPATAYPAGILGLAAYLGVSALGTYFTRRAAQGPAPPPTAPAGTGTLAGRAALSLFLYLEVLDASFSFDGVVAAFAITTDILAIAAGLGVGALFVRSLTIYLVRRDTLNRYVYLEHGAHYAIGVLAAILLVSPRYAVPDTVTGLVSLVIIAAAMFSSVHRNHTRPDHGPAT